MNEEAIILRELLDIFHEEELIRLAYRLGRAGKPLSSLALSCELALREAHFSGAADPPVTPQDAPGSS